MVVKVKTFVALLVALLSLQCIHNNAQNIEKNVSGSELQRVIPAAERIDAYLPLIIGRKVALMVNQSSLVGKQHLIDTLLSREIQIKKIFAPEHGFRGNKADGEIVANGIDPNSRLSVISLYGKKKKPEREDLSEVDLVLFDIQDVGVRFYTFTSALSYLMEACAEFDVPLIVLDRPNPLGFYVDGPMLKPEFKSYIGLHPVPVVYGMTIGEWATMINEEGWLANGVKCNLKVVPCENYDHNSHYNLPIKPSPNLPNMSAVYLYPSLCFFEGTQISVGRGTELPFQCFGAPELDYGDFTFTPKSNAASKYPPHENQLCRGVDLSSISSDSLAKRTQIDLSYLLTAWKYYRDKSTFFLAYGYFEKLAGTDELKRQLLEGKSIEQIRASWADDLQRFKSIRKKYLLYKDFE